MEKHPKLKILLNFLPKYIIVDVHMMAYGFHKQRLGEDEYLYAALLLYLDVADQFFRFIDELQKLPGGR